MTVSNSTIKSISKTALKGNYISCFIATAMVMAVWFINYNISAIFSVVTGTIISTVLYYVFNFLFLMPVVLGLLRYFWRLICKSCDNPITIFYYFSSKALYMKALQLLFLLIMRTVFCYLIFSIPVFVFKLITGTWLYEFLNLSIPIWTVNLSNLIYFLKFIAVVATLFSMIKFYLAPMLFVAYENMEVAEAVHLSTVVSKRTILDFIFLIFSFFGWLLLSLFYLPLLFTLPYFLTSFLIHSSYVVEEFNQEINKINQDDIPTFIAGV